MSKENRKRTSRLFYLSAAGLFFAAFFSGCESPLAPFNTSAVDQLKDKALPVISILSPEADTAYSQVVTISGEVTDDGDSLPQLTYKVTDSLGSREKTGSIELSALDSAEGVKAGFSFQFTTSEYSSDILVEINGTDWNGNASVPAKLRLTFSGNTIPSFTAAAASQSISCSWDEVAGADSYRIFYTTDGSIPYENYGESSELLTDARGTDNPYIISGLSNGNPHVFRLMAYSDDGDSWSSELKTMVPLSELTLMPEVYPDFGTISLQWLTYSDQYGYEVYRKEGLSGEEINISGTIYRNDFVDTRVEDDVDYYYSVRPALPGAIKSASASCRSFPLVSGTERTLATILNLDQIKTSATYGDYAYCADYPGNIYICDITDMKNPEVVGYWKCPTTSVNSIMSIAAVEGTIYLAKYSTIYVINVTNPAEPVSLDSFIPDNSGGEHKAQVRDLFCRDSKLYFTATLPSSYSSAREGRYCCSINADGSLTEDWFTGYDYLSYYDVSGDPDGTGDLLLSYWHGSTDNSGVFKVGSAGGQSTFIAGQTTYYYYGAAVDEAEGLAIIIKRNRSTGTYSLEFRDPDTAVVIGSEHELEDSGYRDSYIDDGMFYLLQPYSMTTFRINETAGEYSLEQLYKVNLQGTGANITKCGENTVCGIAGGLQIIRTKQKAPSDVCFTGSWDVHAVDVVGDYVYTNGSADGGSLAVYSFADKGNPEFLGSCDSFNASVYYLKVSGSYAYLSANSNSTHEVGVFVFDISDPEAISRVGFYETDDSINSLEIYGDFLIFYDDGYAEIIDVSDPSKMSRVSRTRVSTRRWGELAIKDGYMFAGYGYNDTGGLKVYDVSDLSSPVLKAEDYTALISRLVISGSRLYGYFPGEDEISVFDISDPEDPQFLQQISNLIDDFHAMPYSGLDAAGNYIFFHGWDEEDNPNDNGLHIYNTENTSIVDRIELNSAGAIGSNEGEIKLCGRYLYVAAGDFICLNIDP